MAIKITFLRAYAPLTKTITKANGQIIKSSYPNALNFTSVDESINSLVDFHKALVKHAFSDSKPCLIKGELSHPLQNEPRKGTTSTNDKTQWVCLDLDDAPFSNAEEFMKAIGFPTISYVWQASSSFGLEKKRTLSGHIFMLLNKPIAAPQLKTWLMGLNFDIPALEKFITLSKSEHALHFPLDITTCQNDKLLFIAEPIFIDLKPPIPAKERIQYVAKAELHLPAEKLKLHSMDALRKKALDKRNALRTVAGLSPLRTKTTMVGEIEVQKGVGAVSNYEVIDCGDYYRYNLNGGDSQAYWHSKTDLTYLHNFKGEPSVLLKEILPDRFAELVGLQASDAQTPSASGDLLLAFREKRTAEYWKGTWNPEAQTLDIHKVKNETQLAHFLMGHGRTPLAYIPEWEIIFDPRNTTVVDEDKHVVNAFIPTPLMRVENTKAGPYPIFQGLLNHAVAPQGSELQEHFLNWLACIIQHRVKTKTCWILHGVQGTGKGTLVNSVIKPIFERYCVVVPAANLTHDFNRWQEHKLIGFIDEIEVDIFEKKSMEGSLRNLITEPFVQTHRKGVDSYESDSFINLIFSANKQEAVRIPVSDRRFNVGVRQTIPYQTNRHIIEVELVKELPHIAHYLLTREADIDKASKIMISDDRNLMQKLSMSSIEETAQALKNGVLSELFQAMPDSTFLNQTGLNTPSADAYVTVMLSCLRDALEGEASKITRDQLRIIFEHTCGVASASPNKFTSFMRHHGILIQPIRVNEKIMRGITVKWKDTAAELRDLKPFLPPTPPVRRIK